MVTRLLVVLLAAVVLLGGGGCGYTPTKGVEKERDMPKPADKDG